MIAGIVACVAGLGLGLGSVVFSLPVFALGVWQQSEPMVVAAHAGAALCWLGLALACPPTALAERLRSPLVLPLLALALWGALAALWSDHPLRSILGPPQSGEGALWSLDAAAYVTAAWWLRDCRPAAFRRLAWGGAVAVLAVGAVNAPILRSATPLGSLPSFFSFPKFLGFSALGLFPVAWLLRAQGGRGWLAMLLAGALGLLLSDNRSAMSGLLMAALFLVPSTGLSHRLVRPLAAMAVVMAAVLPYVLLRHTDWFHGGFSLWSRSILFGAVDGLVFEDAAAALFGHGWHAYQEFLARGIAETGISLVDGQWKDLTRDQFHAHNGVIQAAFAIGLPGVLLMLLSRVAIVWGAARAAVGMATAFAVCLTLTEATWFMLAASLAYLGLAIAALAPPLEPAPTSAGRGRGAARIFTLASALVGCGLSGLLLVHAQATRQLITCIKANQCPSAPFPDHFIGDGSEIGALINTVVGGRTGAFNNQSLANLIRRVALRRDRPPSALLSLALCHVFGRAAFLPQTSRFGALTHEDETLWRDEVLRLLEIAPSRLDIAAIHLNWLVQQGRENEDTIVLPELERRFPNHPVAQWFRGLRMIAGADAGQRSAGLIRLRQALDGGLKRFVIVPPEVEAGIRNAGPVP